MSKRKDISVPEKPSFVTSQFDSLLKKSKMYIIKTSDDVQTPEDIKNLLKKAKSVDLNEKSTEEDYDQAKKIWREVKDCHISLRNNTDSLKEPINMFKKDIDAFSDKVYQPLKKAEKYVKEKMGLFEKNMELNKEEFKARQKKKDQEQNRIHNLLTDLNNNRYLIVRSKTVSDIKSIQDKLNSINFDDFGDSSGEASFIVQNLLDLCKAEYIKLSSDDQFSKNTDDFDGNTKKGSFDNSVENNDSEKEDLKNSKSKLSEKERIQTIDFGDSTIKETTIKKENQTILKETKKVKDDPISEDLTDGGEVTSDSKYEEEISTKEEESQKKETDSDHVEHKDDLNQGVEKEIPKIYKNKEGEKFFAIEYVNESVKLSYENFLTIRDEETEEVTDLFTVAYREFEEDCKLPSKIQVTFENAEGEREIATYKRE